jgi:hypothetical protein
MITKRKKWSTTKKYHGRDYPKFKIPDVDIKEERQPATPLLREHGFNSVLSYKILEAF